MTVLDGLAKHQPDVVADCFVLEADRANDPRQPSAEPLLSILTTLLLLEAGKSDTAPKGAVPMLHLGASRSRNALLASTA